MLAAVIVVSWIASMIAAAALKSYEPEPVVHALMMLVATTAFGTNMIRKGGDQ